MFKLLLIFMLLLILLIGVFIILKNDVNADDIVAWCCNDRFPYTQPKEASAGMSCSGGHYSITCEICARYWSAYLEYGETDPQEMCQYLPGTPPLPDVPIPSNFNVIVNEDDYPVIEWTHYYVHEYRIERKIGSGSWTNIATITNDEIESYIDYITYPDPKGRTIYYRMRGKVYDAYSEYTDELVPGINKRGMLARKRVANHINNNLIPQQFELYQNYPNPFNSTTAIRFQLPHATQISLKIYNIRGEEIRSVIAQRMLPGVQQLEWDGTDNAGRGVASGIYIYQLIAGDNKQVNKMILAYQAMEIILLVVQLY